MPCRRTFLTLLAALPFGVTSDAASATAPVAATAFIGKTADRLVTVINGAGTLEERRKGLAPIIDGAVDVDGVARFCLGRFWRAATPDQQQQYLSLFRPVLIGDIAVKLGDYRGVSYALGYSSDRDEGELVTTTVNRPNKPPTTMQWLVANAATNPKIIDVIVEGTSLRVTRREDYASFLTHTANSISALLDAMHRQVEQTG